MGLGQFKLLPWNRTTNRTWVQTVSVFGWYTRSENNAAESFVRTLPIRIVRFSRTRPRPIRTVVRDRCFSRPFVVRNHMVSVADTYASRAHITFPRIITVDVHTQFFEMLRDFHFNFFVIFCFYFSLVVHATGHQTRVRTYTRHDVDEHVARRFADWRWPAVRQWSGRSASCEKIMYIKQYVYKRKQSNSCGYQSISQLRRQP